MKATQNVNKRATLANHKNLKNNKYIKQERKKERRGGRESFKNNLFTKEQDEIHIVENNTYIQIRMINNNNNTTATINNNNINMKYASHIASRHKDIYINTTYYNMY